MNGAPLAAALLAGLLGLAAAQAQTPVPVDLELDATVLNEGFEPAVDVSGRTLMGVMPEPSGDPVGDGPARRLYVWLPEGLDTRERHLCISLNSRDGHYTSLLDVALDPALKEHDLASPLSDAMTLQVNYITDKPDYYTQYVQTPPPHRLAVLAELKRDCSPAASRVAVLIAGWQPLSAPQTLNVIANSSRLETLLAVPVTNADGELHFGVMCQPIEVPQRIAYDTACRLERAQLEEQGAPKYEQAVLVRRRGASLADQVTVELAP